MSNESRIAADEIAVHEKKGATMAVEDDEDDLDENAGNYNVARLSLITHSSPAQISFPMYSRGRESAPRDMRSVECTQADLGRATRNASACANFAGRRVIACQLLLYFLSLIAFTASKPCASSPTITSAGVTRTAI